MKKSILAALSVISCSFANAVPREIYIASPKKIVVNADQVALTFELACSNPTPNDWAGNLIAVSDDEGDQAVALGVVLSKTYCEPGPLKNFTFTYPLSRTGMSKTDLENGGVFEPINLAQPKALAKKKVKKK